MLKIIGTFENFLHCVLVTTSGDGEPSMQIVWYHTDEASRLIRTSPLNSVHRMVAQTRFMLCLHGGMWTVLYLSGVCSLEPSASSSLVACGRGVATELPACDCAGSFHLLAA